MTQSSLMFTLVSCYDTKQSKCSPHENELKNVSTSSSTSSMAVVTAERPAWTQRRRGVITQCDSSTRKTSETTLFHHITEEYYWNIILKKSRFARSQIRERRGRVDRHGRDAFETFSSWFVAVRKKAIGLWAFLIILHVESLCFTPSYQK